ncbi:COG1180: Radical SAM, Pyruvate-formate lyase-activating enzyme like [hydrothermal vent metagenome]|uniref:COG1180: Radical SAM, Pyruvate-formate lyase-activating enzyme like n=1 Tax=hydrothermal vent metagenome TaxID=652676 RepID=A0A3B0U4U8_9ZZZZ
MICDLCPRQCSLKKGQRGFCFVRKNIDGRMALTTYGRSSGFCIDPIEKKPLNHFYPGTSVLSFGTAGCNLGCKFCQNWSISKSKEFDSLTQTATPKMIANGAKKYGCRSVAFTYNDPVIFAEYAIDVARECRSIGIKTVAVTAGYISVKARKEFFSYMDAANVDLKSFSEHFYKKVTLSGLEEVLDTLKFLRKETSVWLEITNLFIPGENDSMQEIDALTKWIFKNLGNDVPLHFSAFHPDYKMMDYSATPQSTLTKARTMAMSNGLRYVYTGNVHDREGSSTYCHKCGELLIERDWYVLGKYNLNGNECAECKKSCSGVFDTSIGQWGSKRMPISL